MIKLKDNRKQIVGFQGKRFRIYKLCGTINYYRYQIVMHSFNRYVTIYKGNYKCKLLNRYLLTIISFILDVISYPIIEIAKIIFNYFEGGYRFIINSSLVTGVRFFNWINIFIIIALSIIIYVNNS